MIRALFGGMPALALALCAVLAPMQIPAHAQTGRNVLVVVNGANPDSVSIGEYYATRRSVPAEQVLRLTALPPDPTDGIDRKIYDLAIQSPIAQWLGRHQAQDRILFIVLTKGVPLRINALTGENTAASVDSELSMLYVRLTGAPVSLDGPLPNPLFLGERAPAGVKPFSRVVSSLYLVTRLDGYTTDDVLGLIDRALAPSRDGRFVLDGKSTWTTRDAGNAWLKASADRLTSAGLPSDRITGDQSAIVLADLDDVLGYYSWGSNDPAIRRRDFNLKFRNGAIGGMFVSTDGRTFREPPKDWQLPSWDQKSAWFAGSPQSLSGDLIRAGITGVAGHVAEPLLGNTIRPDILFPAYVAGFTLAESFYFAMPSLSWMTVVVGDPLCAPFAAAPRAIEDPAIDPATELPALFSDRRLAVLTNEFQAPLEARQAALRAQSRLSRDDTAGARADLERATTLVPTAAGLQFLLASQYEIAGEFDAAISRYRKVLELSPDSVPTLNNLAFLLAVRKGDLREARPLAERAHALAPKSGEIVDTLGWIIHMAGDGAKAVALLTEAVALSPTNAEIHLHLAQAYSAVGNVAAAKMALARALELNSSLEKRPEVIALQRQ